MIRGKTFYPSRLTPIEVIEHLVKQSHVWVTPLDGLQLDTSELVSRYGCFWIERHRS